MFLQLTRRMLNSYKTKEIMTGLILVVQINKSEINLIRIDIQ